jgi:hypothetical protein
MSAVESAPVAGASGQAAAAAAPGAASAAAASDEVPTGSGLPVGHKAPLLQKDAEAQLNMTGASALIPILLTFGVAMGAFEFGLHIGYSSPNERAIQATVRQHRCMA